MMTIMALMTRTIILSLHNDVLCSSYRKSVVFVVAPKECCVIDDGFRMAPSLADLNAYTHFMKCLFQLLDIPFHLIEETDPQLRRKLVLDIIKPLLLGKYKSTTANNHCAWRGNKLIRSKSETDLPRIIAGHFSSYGTMMEKSSSL